MAAMSLAPVNTTHADDRPIIVFREDDGRATWRTRFAGLDGMSGLEYGKLKKIPITWGIVSSLSNNNVNGSYLSWSEVKDYVQAAGGEVASHSLKHIVQSTQQNYTSELAASKAAIEQNTGYPCRTFIQPGVWGTAPDSTDTLHAYMDTMPELNNAIGQAIQANYDQSMAYLGAGWGIGKNYYKYGLTSLYSIDYHMYPSIPAMQATLDVVANTPGLVFVVTCHGVQETGATQTYHIQADMLKAFMDRLADLRDSGKVRLMGLNEAYHTAFSEDLNHIPDPGFEAANPSLNPVGPWQPSNGASIAASGGVDDSKYGVVSGSDSTLRCGNIILAPGRYELSWYQKALSGPANSTPLRVTVGNWEPAPRVLPLSVIDSAPFFNSAPGVWERKTALLLIKDCFPSCVIRFVSQSGTAYGVDNVSLKTALLDENVSSTRFSISPTPAQVGLSWMTPADPSVKSVQIKYGTTTHPLAPTQGTLLATVQATPGTMQQVSVPIDWTKLDKLYFSAFAIKSDGTFAAPGITTAFVDKTAPTDPELDVKVEIDLVVNARWFASAPQSCVFQYQYAVGTGPSKGDVIPWTPTKESSIILTNLPAKPNLYLSTMAQNGFGFWSSISSKQLNLTFSIAAILKQPDGATVTLSGVVSGVFADCCYVEERNRARGLKLIGNIAGLREGDTALVSGTLTTIQGERALRL